MNDRPPNWDDLTRRRAPSSESTDTFAELCATILTSPLGREFVAALRKMTIERRSPEGASADVLRELEAERRFVQKLEQARDRGIEMHKKKAVTPA